MTWRDWTTVPGSTRPSSGTTRSRTTSRGLRHDDRSRCRHPALPDLQHAEADRQDPPRDRLRNLRTHPRARRTDTVEHDRRVGLMTKPFIHDVRTGYFVCVECDNEFDQPTSRGTVWTADGWLLALADEYEHHCDP